MGTEIDLARLEVQLAGHRRLLVRGLVSLALAAGMFTACRLLHDWAIPFVLLVTAAIGTMAFGMIWTVEGALKTLVSAREIRRLRQLPEARVIDR